MYRRMPGRVRFFAPARRPIICFFLPALICLVFAVAPLTGHAQQLDPSTLGQLQSQAQRLGAVPGSLVNPANPDLPTTTVLQPDQAVPRGQQLPTSRLEEIISRRAGVQLRQFGYSALGFGRPVTVSQTGALQDDYILGVGDEIVVSLRGQENSEQRVTVNRDGQVTFPRLSPISAAGRSLARFRDDVAAAVSRAYVATNAFVSVGRVRQVSVLVAGEVNAPGQRVVSGLSSVLDAILLAGGVKKAGSLRNVRLQRGRQEYVIDLYSVLTGGNGSASIQLMDGDRIRVPFLGATVAVSGIVRQPGIFELPSGATSLTVRSLIALAGGEEIRGLYRLSLLRVEADGRTSLVALNDDSGIMRDSDVLMVQLGADQTVSRATLAGGVSLAGSYPIARTKLSDIVKTPGMLGSSPYTPIGLISRRDPATLLRSLTIFTPLAVLRGNEDMDLQGDDIIRPISLKEAAMLVSSLRDYQSRVNSQREAVRNPVSSVNIGSADQAQGNSLIANSLRSNSGTDVASLNRQAVQELGGGPSVPVSGIQQRGANLPQDPAQYLGQDPGRYPLSPQFPGGAPEQDGQRLPQDGLQRDFQGLQQRGVPETPLPENFQDQSRNAEYAPNREVTTVTQLAQQLGVDPIVLVNVLLEREVTLNGAVRAPGTYLVGPNVPLQDLLTAAGGVINWADLSGVELLSVILDPGTGLSRTQLNRLPLNSGQLASYIVRPHDEFRFNEIFTDANLGTVTVEGEVRFTGAFKLRRGERLSDLLTRAGGLTNTAYPYGTIFLRKSTAIQEQESYLRAANQVQEQLMIALTRSGNQRLDPATFTSLQSFVAELRNQKAIGRVAIQADPSILAANPSLDPLLEPNDVIYIPPRPTTVAVYGQVMQPGSFPYRPQATVEDYLAMAGGYSRSADEGDTFLVLPDGSARKMERSWLRLGKETALPPGSAIVVPRDVTPVDLRQILLDTTQILSQLAVSVASIAVLSKD